MASFSAFLAAHALGKGVDTKEVAVGCEMQGFYTAKDYVQDGLIAMWDGIENVGFGTHSGSAIVWKDLIGGYDQEIESGSWDSCGLIGGIVGKLQYDSNAYGFWDAYNAGTSCTFEFVLKVVSGRSRIRVCDSTFGFVLQTSGDIGGDIYNSSRVFGLPNGTRTLGKGVSQVLSFSQDSEGNKYYGNGVLRTSGNVVFSKQSYPRRDALKFNATDQLFCVRSYNRMLSDDEIAHNYAIDKARFNLP